MSLKPQPVSIYHVFLASPGDVMKERQHVRSFFDEYNRTTARLWNVRFEVIDWENYSTIGVGQPQELITAQTLERYRASLALVVGIMAQRFGSPTSKAESGTEEEFQWAMHSHQQTGFPEVKWFFRKAATLELPPDPDAAQHALEQWKKVLEFRKRMQGRDNPVFYTEYPGADGFARVFDHDLMLWLADPSRPWVPEAEVHAASTLTPAAFDTESYSAALRQRFEKLTFDMLDVTGAYYNDVRLWSVFVPQSARECQEYHPQLLEIPKEHQRRLREAGELDDQASEAEDEHLRDRRRRDYFNQTPRPILEIIEDSAQRRTVILGDPGSGKSSLLRFLALRWARIADANLQRMQAVPIFVELGHYGRWECNGPKDLSRYLQEGTPWYRWNPEVLRSLLQSPARALLLLDGLDEIFEARVRDDALDEIQRFAAQYPDVPIIVTSRVIGYKPQRLRDAGFRNFMLQDLSLGTPTQPGQVEDFLQRWHHVTAGDIADASQKRDRLLRAIRESRPIAELAGNPLLLTMMAILNRNQELPRGRAELYEQATRVLLHHWDTERALGDYPELRDQVGFREKIEILRRIAHAMQDGPRGLRGNFVDEPTLERLIEGYLYDELRFDQARAAARAVVRQLRERNFILCFLGAGSYAFVHRTFLEYFCALEIVHQFNRTQSLKEDELIQIFDRHHVDDDWREVLRLVCSQIDEGFVGKIVDHLVQAAEARHTDSPYPELTLAIWCLSEIRNTSRLTSVGQRLLTRIVDVFLYGTNSDPSTYSFVLDLLEAARALGSRWPGASEFHFSGQHPAARDDYGNFVHQQRWPFFLSAVFKERSWIAQLASQSAPRTRSGAILALSENWPDDSTRDFVTSRVTADSDPEVRSTALEALAETWPDDSTRALLRARACDDTDPDPRSTALEVLGQVWSDDSTRVLLTARAAVDPDSGPRSTALLSLAEKWPDDSTREFLFARACDDHYANPRTTAIRALAEHWPDELTRALVCARASDDPSSYPRAAALGALAVRWPDANTRAFISSFVSDDQEALIRSTALEILAATWPDQATRALLSARVATEPEPYTRGILLEVVAKHWNDDLTRSLLSARATDDPEPSLRSRVPTLLAKLWPDAITRALLSARATDDPSPEPRSAALKALGDHWSDGLTRTLLAARATDDPSPEPRSTAIEALGKQWPDDHTRSLLSARASEDPDPGARSTALEVLAKQWSDEPTRILLSARTSADPSYGPRSTAIVALSSHWSDELTRTLISARASEDPFMQVRNTAIEVLVDTWPDEVTRAFILDRAARDPAPSVRQAALQAISRRWPGHLGFPQLVDCANTDASPHVRRTAVQILIESQPMESIRSLLVAHAPADGYAASLWGKQHSYFGHIVLTRDLDGRRPYLDPREPISASHIEQAARRCNIGSDELAATVQSLSAHLGWDITVGSGAPPDPETNADSSTS